jgi:protein-S-isoprenylcysteine O-methyltransferase Ste14
MVAHDGRRRPRRDDLTGEHRFGDAGQLISAIVFGATWTLDGFVFGWTTFWNEAIPGWLRIALGGFLIAIALVLAVMSLRAVFGEKRDPPVVIRTGLYGLVRHPLYLSEVVLYLGLNCLRVSLAAILAWLGIMFFLRYLCRYEERLLLDRFGDDYRAYMQEVPMWLPRFRRPRS